MRDAFNDISWWSGINDPGVLMVNMLVLGDTWQADTTDPGYGVDMRTGVSWVSGYGRLHAHWPSDDNLTAPWGWGWRKVYLPEGWIIGWTVGDAGPEPVEVTQWKWAVTWYEQDMANIPAIAIGVLDACNGWEAVASDVSGDFRRRIHLRSEEIGGKCLVMVVWVLATKNAGVWLYSADYFHSGNAAFH
jgi:hypothetical protein